MELSAKIIIDWKQNANIFLQKSPLLTLFSPMFPFDPPKNIRKSKVFCFQRDQKETLGRKGLNGVTHG